MPFDGNGNYELPSPAYPAIAGAVITAANRNTIDEDLASALSNLITRDGQSPPTANLPMAGFKHTGLGAGASNGDSLRFEQLFGSGQPATAAAARTNLGAGAMGGSVFQAADFTAAMDALSAGAVGRTVFAAATIAAVKALLPTQAGTWKFLTGTATEWTDIPSGTRAIFIGFDGLSTTGPNPPLVQIGNASAYATSLYTGTCTNLPNAGAISNITSSLGFLASQSSSGANVVYGGMLLILLDSSSNTWLAIGLNTVPAGPSMGITCGSRFLSGGELTRIRLTTTTGVDTFDSGQANVVYW
jgi:hypothetical protein